ncbi:IS110 family transposase [Mesorhizobium sp. ISC11]|uniref:IS110 family transposase n=1 Tax=Mesorhizobium sp. ISC11 TaxID=3076428 RepID=UPI00301BB520
MNRIICGVDVSKDWLDAHIWPGGAAARFANDAAGIAALWLFCRSHDAALAVMEASGGYERLGFMLLWTHGMPCGVVNAKSVRRFAEAMGYLEKTDRIDAAVIAHYGAVKNTVPTPPPSAAQQRLAALVGRLCQIVGDATINKQRRSAARDAEVCASIEAMLAFLKREQRRLEGEIASMIDDDPLWARLEQVSNKAIAKLAGLAPFANDSGKRTGNRHVRGGRAGPRGILFIVAAIVAKFDPNLKAFAQRLQQAGKPKMLIRIALARKLLVILNAKARDARNEFASAT